MYSDNNNGQNFHVLLMILKKVNISSFFVWSCLGIRTIKLLHCSHFQFINKGVGKLLQNENIQQKNVNFMNISYFPKLNETTKTSYHKLRQKLIEMFLYQFLRFICLILCKGLVNVEIFLWGQKGAENVKMVIEQSLRGFASVWDPKKSSEGLKNVMMDFKSLKILIKLIKNSSIGPSLV